MKKKVTFVVSKYKEHAEAQDCAYRQAEIDFPDGWTSLRPIAISVQTEGPQSSSGESDLYESVATVVNHQDIGNLVGKLLTYIDATFTDKDQRKAHKDLVTQHVWDWYTYHERSAEKIIEFAKTHDNPILK